MKAICVLTNNNPGITGHIEFIKQKNNMSVKVKVEGLNPGNHGIHIHTKGNLLEGCSTLCSHFNPYNTNHGARENNKENRHVGDLGNIQADKHGKVDITFTDKLIKLNK